MKTTMLKSDTGATEVYWLRCIRCQADVWTLNLSSVPVCPFYNDSGYTCGGMLKDATDKELFAQTAPQLPEGLDDSAAVAWHPRGWEISQNGGDGSWNCGDCYCDYHHDCECKEERLELGHAWNEASLKSAPRRWLLKDKIAHAANEYGFTVCDQLIRAPFAYANRDKLEDDDFCGSCVTALLLQKQRREEANGQFGRDEGFTTSCFTPQRLREALKVTLEKYSDMHLAGASAFWSSKQGRDAGKIFDQLQDVLSHDNDLYERREQEHERLKSQLFPTGGGAKLIAKFDPPIQVKSGEEISLTFRMNRAAENHLVSSSFDYVDKNGHMWEKMPKAVNLGEINANAFGTPGYVGPPIRAHCSFKLAPGSLDHMLDELYDYHYRSDVDGKSDSYVSKKEIIEPGCPQCKRPNAIRVKASTMRCWWCDNIFEENAR